MMTFSASNAELWLAAGGASLAAVALAALEWRRPDRRRLAWRVTAVMLAVAALALLGLHPAWRQRRSPAKAGVMAGLWTSADAGGADEAGIPSRYRIALPGVAAPTAGATVFPDTATLRRRFPEIATVQVFGEGLDAGNLDALRGLRVVFHPGASDPRPGPSIRFVHCPRTLTLGEPLVVEGEVAGLVPGSHPTLTLEAPDGSSVKTGAVAAGADGRANFTLRAAPPAATGRFNWRLRLMPPAERSGPAWETESLGIAVVKPMLPRVLVLESSPHFDTADLRRWFAGAGGRFIVRTLVGKDRYRFAAAGDQAAPEFSVLEAPMLAGFDLVLADPPALAALAPPEREALLAAVTGAGLGVLVLEDEMPPPAVSNLPLFPWQLAAAPDASPEDGERLERPTWVGQSDPIAIPIPSAPVVLAPLPGQSALLRDGQGRTLAAALPRGRGQLALTLLHDSGRWLRANDAAAFGEYWSFLFSRLARPVDEVSGPGRWMVAESEPICAGQPVTLLWSGPAPAKAAAQITAGSGAAQDNATLALARDPAEPSRWRGIFWPRQAGWYRVSAASGENGANGTNGASLDFFVDRAGSWSGVAAERRRLATARFAQESGAVVAPLVPGIPAKANTAGPAVCFFLLFLAGAGFLWTERRLSRL